MQSAWAILSSVGCPALQYFSTLRVSHIQHDFRRKGFWCASISSTNFLWNISHSRQNWARDTAI